MFSHKLSQSKILISGISAMALLAALPAHPAETANNPDTPPAQSVTQEDISAMIEAGGENLAEGAETVAELPSRLYHDLRAALAGEEPVMATQDSEQMTVWTAKRADHIIGSSLRDSNGMTVAVIDDIFVGKSGKPEKIIARDGGFFGFGGKLVAFDYNAIAGEDADGIGFKPVGAAMLTDIAAYDPAADSGKGWHVSTLLGADMKAPDGTAVAKVDDIVIEGGRADNLVVSYGTTLGMGGQQAVVDLDDVAMVRGTDETFIQLTQAQADVFRALDAASTTATVY